MSPPDIPPPILIPESPLIISKPPLILAPASSPVPSSIVIRPLFWPKPAQFPAVLSQVILLPLFPAPKNERCRLYEQIPKKKWIYFLNHDLTPNINDLF